MARPVVLTRSSGQSGNRQLPALNHPGFEGLLLRRGVICSLRTPEDIHHRDGLARSRRRRVIRCTCGHDHLVAGHDARHRASHDRRVARRIVNLGRRKVGSAHDQRLGQHRHDSLNRLGWMPFGAARLGSGNGGHPRARGHPFPIEDRDDPGPIDLVADREPAASGRHQGLGRLPVHHVAWKAKGQGLGLHGPHPNRDHARRHDDAVRNQQRPEIPVGRQGSNHGTREHRVRRPGQVAP